MAFKNTLKMLSLPAWGIHLAFLLIIIGAIVTWCSAGRGTLRLKQGSKPASSFVTENGKECDLPFSVSLLNMEIVNYSGTQSPLDYKSVLLVEKENRKDTITVSMNRIASPDNYRLYQSGMGEDYTVLKVYHDPWGIGITYAGYYLLFASMILFFFSRRTRFRALLRSLGVIVLIIQAIPASASSEECMTLQRPLAHTFGELYCEWNGRIAPVQTMAHDFCVKVHGNPQFRGLTAEQVLTGWLFYYDSWKNIPFIKVKNKEIRDILGITDSYAALTDFYDRNGYKLQPLIKCGTKDKSVLETDEKVNLVTMACTGSIFRIYPIICQDSDVLWQSWTEKTPRWLDSRKSAYITTSMSGVARAIATGQYNEANRKLEDIRKNQISEVSPDKLPGQTRWRSERIYNSLPPLMLVAGIALLCAILGLVTYMLDIYRPEGLPASPRMTILSAIISAFDWAIWIYVTFVIILLWIIGEHIPLSNGEETMLAIAWSTLLVSLFSVRSVRILRPIGMTAAAFALVVAGINATNPAVNQMLPVLHSPLLSVHVLLVMFSYALFAIITLVAISSLIAGKRIQDGKVAKRLTTLSDLLLYPAIFLLGAGIFTGAIWANVSWGRYWGWDPKETWALITFLVYAVPLHGRSMKWFRNPRFASIYYLFAFLCVLFTYFGVNFLLSGMHSYA